MSILSYKRCCCSAYGCTPSWSDVPLTQDDLYFSWAANADHAAGTMTLSWYENTNWKGWWGLLPCTPTTKAGITPTVRSGFNGSCLGVCGGSSFNFLFFLTCDDVSSHTLSRVYYAVPPNNCHLDPGAVVLPGSGPPTIANGTPTGGCVGGVATIASGRTLTFGTKTSSPFSTACSFSTPLVNYSGITYSGYTFDYSGVITR